MSIWRSAWLDQVACSEADAELFFSSDTTLQTQAKWICARCPVRQDCLRHALTYPEHQGIWGGFDPEERRLIARRIREKRVERARSRKRRSQSA